MADYHSQVHISFGHKYFCPSLLSFSRGSGFDFPFGLFSPVALCGLGLSDPFVLQVQLQLLLSLSIYSNLPLL